MVSGGAETLPVVGEDALVDHNDKKRTDTVKPSGKQLHKHCQRFVRHPRQVLIPLRVSAPSLPSLPELTHRYTCRAHARGARGRSTTSACYSRFIISR